MIKKNRARWECLEEKILLDFPYLQWVERLCQKQFENESPENPHRFYALKTKNWCNILPITSDGKIILVRPFRAGTLSYPYEFPGGVMDATDPNPESAALRELEEETGFTRTARSKVHFLGTTFPNPALQDNQVHLYAVTHVQKTTPQKLDASEDLSVETVTIDEMIQLIEEGKFEHALMINTLFFFLMRTLGSDVLRAGFRQLGL